MINKTTPVLLVLFFAALLLSGCVSYLDWELDPAGAGGGSACKPGEVAACYSGPEGTEGVGSASPDQRHAPPMVRALVRARARSFRSRRTAPRRLMKTATAWRLPARELHCGASAREIHPASMAFASPSTALATSS